MNKSHRGAVLCLRVFITFIVTLIFAFFMALKLAAVYMYVLIVTHLLASIHHIHITHSHIFAHLVGLAGAVSIPAVESVGFH